MDINAVFIIGRLTVDPANRKSENNLSITNFAIANNRKYGEEKHTNFLNCVAFGKQSELISQYCKKGMRIGVIGRVQQRSYESNGTKKSVVEIVVDSFQFLDNVASKESMKQVDKPPVVDDNPFENNDLF